MFPFLKEVLFILKKQADLSSAVKCHRITSKAFEFELKELRI